MAFEIIAALFGASYRITTGSNLEKWGAALMIKTYRGLRMVVSPAFEGKGHVLHGFLTKRHGETERPVKRELAANGGHMAQNQDEAILALSAAFKIPEKSIVQLAQIHGSNVLLVHRDLPSQNRGKIGPFDAAVTSVRGILLTVSTADCVPILLFDAARGAAAAIHAGWRGSLEGISSKTVGVMVERFGSHPANIFAAIGPSIGKCCYEVGPEVAKAASGALGPIDGLMLPLERGKWLFDLKRLNFIQLMEKGLSPDNIHISRYCTMCEPELFHSYRREGAGCPSQISFIGMA